LQIKLKSHRFDKRKISLFLKESQTIRVDMLTIFYMNDGNQHYAFICPKKISASTPARNKIKRQLKASFLKLASKIDPSYSMIIMANKKIRHTTFKNIHDMLLLTLKKKNIINESS
jgi:ribonuclease P protein component